MENWETIAFAFSLLLFIISITIPLFVYENNTSEAANGFILISMIFIGLTTPLSILPERQHKVPSYLIKVLYIITILLVLIACVAFFVDKIAYLENVIVAFLGISVILSMFLIRKTKPKKNVAHLEKVNRIFAIVFLIVVPMSLAANYIFVDKGYNLRIGFTLPLVFILLALNKLLDDLQRLYLIKPHLELNEQHFKNYSLSDREKEVAKLLAKGKTYKQISEMLFISMPTVKSHASNIYKKCGVKTRSELIVLLIN
ncbi:helix-turn-helix transcriptional regulator [Aureibaculum sp. 2210JD6-5]|uniref:response regulator transcription factor n=1 Tax=Aureibaculum sp. 2210JD6-5 TaxID=3103957 RepID=UPI002AAE613B|nr:helix-turn-helix transcriptional regulator [Aureibaculum sp. 2210JD6-5]MDY7395292.1 helix-turn-helix transcriptional regulator [Aureibaculum sp. 2210JD6-5]